MGADHRDRYKAAQRRLLACGFPDPEGQPSDLYFAEIMATLAEQRQEVAQAEYDQAYVDGLLNRRRERIAVATLQGIVSTRREGMTCEQAVGYAIQYTDTLIAALDRRRR